MQKARYSTVNIGHYGLAFDFYTHFTSPIRRFPDMMVHRLLTRYLAGGRTAQKDKYEDLCDHSSEMEQIASNAERASVKYKQVEFMSERVGLEFEGVISGVTEWGLYVEINENKCEGMVPMRDLGDDYYDFDEKNYCLIGRRHHKKFSLGDPVTIKVARATWRRNSWTLHWWRNKESHSVREDAKTKPAYPIVSCRGRVCLPEDTKQTVFGRANLAPTN